MNFDKIKKTIFFILLVMNSCLIKGEDVRGQDVKIIERYPDSERIAFDYISKSEEYYRNIHTIGDTYYIDYRTKDNLDRVSEYYINYFRKNNWEIILYEKTSNGDKWVVRKIDGVNEYLAEVVSSIYDEEVMDTKISYRVSISSLPLYESYCKSKIEDIKSLGIVDKLIARKRLVIINDLFYFNKSELRECAKEILRIVGNFMMEKKDFLLKIYVYEDYDDIEEGRFVKSGIKAEVLRNYLLMVYPNLNKRVILEGKGDRELIVDNDTVEGRTKNRRIEFIIEKE